MLFSYFSRCALAKNRGRSKIDRLAYHPGLKTLVIKRDKICLEICRRFIYNIINHIDHMKFLIIEKESTS